MRQVVDMAGDRKTYEGWFADKSVLVRNLLTRRLEEDSDVPCVRYGSLLEYCQAVIDGKERGRQ